MQLRVRLGVARVARVAARLLVTSACAGALASALGCAAGVEPPNAAALRRLFPDQADEVLRGRFEFTSSDEGFERADLAELRARLPERGSDALHFEVPGGIDIRVRELGARGEGVIEEGAIAYERPGGASFWAATGAGYEEWLLLEPSAVTSDAPVAAWEVEGAGLRQRGEAVEVVDGSGEAYVRVTAPAAYAIGGRPVATRLAARGATIELWVAADSEAVLVDPGWIAFKQTMSAPRAGHTVTVLPDGRVLVIGGSGPDPSDPSRYISHDTAELFDPASETWAPVPATMSDARSRHAAALLSDGSVLVVGGYRGDVFLSSAEIFHPDSGTWETVGPMSSPRWVSTATPLTDDDSVLVVGGRDGTGGRLSSAEIFSRKTGKFTPVNAVMSVPHAHHTATRLFDGTVLIVGAVEDSTIDRVVERFHPGSQTWTTEDPLREGRHEHTATLLSDGRVLVAGGAVSQPFEIPISSVEVFMPGAGSGGGVWATYPSLCVARAGHSATLLFGDGRVLIAGGRGIGDGGFGVAERYDFTACGASIGPMRSPRWGHTAAALDSGRVLIAGGTSTYQDWRHAYDTFELFDPTGPKWVSVGSPVAHEQGHSAIELSDSVALITGGRSEALVTTDDVWTFSCPSTPEPLPPPASSAIDLCDWSPGPPMRTARAGHTSTRLMDGRVLVAGGLDEHSQPLADAEVLGPSPAWTEPEWTKAASMSEGRSGHTATLLDDRRVLVVGGLGAEGERLSTVELFNAETFDWSTASPMSAGRAGHTATRLTGGRVLVTGGSSSDGPDGSAELFDPKAGVWTILPPMNALHLGHTATLLPDGRVLIAGNGVDASVELFEPGSLTWTTVPPMTRPRRNHSATLLPEGRVLVSGGTSIFSSLADEIYDPLSQTWTPLPGGGLEYPRHVATLLVGDGVLATSTSGVGAQLFRLQPIGTGCVAPRDCASGFCVDGVCCDGACNAGFCEACSAFKGATEDGACTPLHPECSPFACEPATGGCASPCKSARDCAQGHVCRPPGDCVPLPEAESFLDDTICSVARSSPGGLAGATSPGRMELGLLLLAGLFVMRRASRASPDERSGLLVRRRGAVARHARRA